VCIFWWLGTILSSTSYLPIWVNLLAGVVSGAEREALFSSGKRDSQSGDEVLVHHAQLAAAFLNSCNQKKIINAVVSTLQASARVADSHSNSQLNPLLTFPHVPDLTD